MASAIADGTDAVMLSGETAAGDHPIAACAVMAKIAFRTDQHMADSPPAARVMRLRTTDLHRVRPRRPGLAPAQNFYADAIGQAVCRMTTSLDVRRIICFTTTGYTAAACARYRPPTRITAITNSVNTQRRCALLWGVNAIVVEHLDDFDQMTAKAEDILVDAGLVDRGDTVILVAGLPFVEAGTTNLMKLHVVGNGRG